MLQVRLMNMGTPKTLLPFDLPVHRLRSLSTSQYFSTSLIICHFQLSHPTVSPHSKTVRRPGAIHNPHFIFGVMQPAICNDVLNPINCSDLHRCTLYHNELHRIFGDAATVLGITFTWQTTSPWFDGESRAFCRLTRAFERQNRQFRQPADHTVWRKALTEIHVLFTSNNRLTGFVNFKNVPVI